MFSHSILIQMSTNNSKHDAISQTSSEWDLKKNSETFPIHITSAWFGSLLVSAVLVGEKLCASMENVESSEVTW